MEWCLSKEDVPCRLSCTIQHLVSEMLHIAFLPVSLGFGRNWYQLLPDFQTTLPWQPPWKALSLEQKEWHCQPTRFSIYKFHCTESECQISPLAESVVFLTSSVGHCTWSVPLGGEEGGFVLVVSTFFYFCRGLFDMQHCCTVIILGLWLS